MECHCCRRDVSLVHRVQLRGVVMHDDPPPPPPEPAYESFVNEMTFRTAFICPACYQALDTVDGIGEIGDKIYGLAGRSRGNRAPLYNRAKYDEYQRREALKLGIDGDPPSTPDAA